MTVSGFLFKKTKKPYQMKLLSSAKYVISSLHVSCFSY